MNHSALTADLNQLIGIEACGLCRHLQEAKPYLTEATYAIWGDIERMSGDNNGHAQRLSELLIRLELPQRPATFEPDVASHHFMDLTHLLPLLVEEKRTQVSTYRRAIDHLENGEHEDIAEELTRLLQQNEGQLGKLEAHHRRVASGTSAS